VPRFFGFGEPRLESLIAGKTINDAHGFISCQKKTCFSELFYVNRAKMLME
jgi:hypothetical protein